MEHLSPRNARCQQCDGPTQPGFVRCYCCAGLVRQLQQPLVPVLAATTYRLGDRMHRLLRVYKDGRSIEQRTKATDVLSELLGEWMRANQLRIQQRFGGEWDLAVGVPSTRVANRVPVENIIERVPPLATRQRRLLKRGAAITDHLDASRYGFEVDSGVTSVLTNDGRRSVVVVEDTYSTGARSQSAAAALRPAGFHPVGIIAIGRVIDPLAAVWQANYWAEEIRTRRNHQ